VMDEVGVDAAWISSLDAIHCDYVVGNDAVGEAIRKFPERFVGYAVVNPNYPDAVEAELRRCFEELGMKAIKFHGGNHQYKLDGPSYAKVLEFADCNGLVILCHGLGTKPLQEIAADYPRAKFIIAHQGGRGLGMEDTTPEPIAAAMTCDNVFVDSSGSVEYFGAFDRLVDVLGPEKIVFGSDFPVGDVRFMVGRVLYGKMSDDAKRRILGLNAGELLAQ